MAEQRKESDPCEEEMTESSQLELNELEELENMFQDAEAATAKSRENAKTFFDEEDDPFFDCMDNDDWEMANDVGPPGCAQEHEAIETRTSAWRVEKTADVDITKKGCLIQFLERNQQTPVEGHVNEAGQGHEVVLPLLKGSSTQHASAKALCATPTKRFRITGKKTPIKTNAVKKLILKDEYPWDSLTRDAFAAWVHDKDKSKEQHAYLKSLIKLAYNSTRYYFLASCKKKNASHDNEPRKQWKKLTPAERKAFAEKLVESESSAVNSKQKLAIDVCFGINITQPEDCKESTFDKEHPYLRAKFGMFTYFAPQWNLVRKNWSLENINEVVAKCQEDKYVKAIQNKCADEMERLVVELDISKWAWSLELCPKALAENEITIHLTFVAKWEYQKKVYTPQRLAIFNGIAPQHVQTQKEKTQGRRADVCEPFFYYVQCPKLGMIYHVGNYRPYTDFIVKDKWLIGYLQKEKMTPKVAIEDHKNSKNYIIFLCFGAIFLLFFLHLK